MAECLPCMGGGVLGSNPRATTKTTTRGETTGNLHNESCSQHLSAADIWSILLSPLEFIVIHNGIITNYKDLKKFLVSEVTLEDTVF